MCGIVGVLSLDGQPVEGDRVAAMRDAMAHRGPDGAGLWTTADRRLSLGHRRLKILDLSAAADQPMVSADGSLAIVFNGEIYNHAEIREDLLALGPRRFATDHSDTETILHAYDAWGIDCIDRFRGMFAFGLWDGRARRLWLARDRIGVKPLYWTRAGGALLFASEIKALLAHPAVTARLDRESLFHYLSFLVAPAPRTMFKGISKLPPATRMSVDLDGTVRTERYWDVLDRTEPLTGVGDWELSDRLLDLLKTSVGYRKLSDVPVGVFLSGGLDSATNAALFADGIGPVRTFSIGFQGEHADTPDELPAAARMAALVHAEHHETRIGLEDLLAFAREMVRFQDEPVGDPVCVPLHHLARLAREHGTIVCQVGEGSDELFYGYASWRTHRRVAALDGAFAPRDAKRALMGVLAAIGRGDGPAYEALRRSTTGAPLFWGGAEGLTQREKGRVLGDSMRREFAGKTSAEILAPIHQRFLERAWEPTSLHWMTYLDLNLRLPELLLMRVDKMTMAASVEGRVPFLDHKLVEFAMSVPTEAMTRGGTMKPLLKRAVTGLVPEDVIGRPKQGFGIPILDWMRGGLGGRMRADLGAFASRTGLFDANEIGPYVERGKPSKVWQLWNFALWHEAFVEKIAVGERA